MVFHEYSGWSCIFSVYFLHVIIFLFVLSLLDFEFFKSYGYYSASCSPIQNLFQYSTNSSCLTDNCYQTDYFPSQSLIETGFLFFFLHFALCKISDFNLQYGTWKNKRSLESTWIWNSKEMGHPNWSKQCGDFMHKRNLCFVSVHLLLVTVTYFFCVYRGLDFLQSGFRRPLRANSSL